MKRILRQFKNTAVMITGFLVGLSAFDTSEAQTYRVPKADKKVGTVLPVADVRGYLTYQSPVGAAFLGVKTMWDSPWNMMFGMTIVPSDVDNNRSVDRPRGTDLVVGGLPSIALVYKKPYVQGYIGTTKTAYYPETYINFKVNPYDGVQTDIKLTTIYFHNSADAFNRDYGKGINPNITKFDQGFTSSASLDFGYRYVNSSAGRNDHIQWTIGFVVIHDQDLYDANVSWRPTVDLHYSNNGITVGLDFKQNIFDDQGGNQWNILDSAAIYVMFNLQP